MIEPEMAFADLNDNMALAESMLKYVIRYVLEHAPEEMNFFNQFIDKGLLERLNHVLNSEFGHVTYTEAVKLLEEHNDEFDYKVFWGCDLQTEHERYLDREDLPETGIQSQLSERNQSILYEDERRQQDGSRYGLSRTGNRRDYRRKPEGRRLRQTGGKNG